jgi:flagellar basal-body rod protein FlgG
LTDAEGVLVTSKGDPVMGESGAISIEGKEVVIDEAGSVMADGNQIDTLEIVSFGRPERLRKEGQGYYVYDGDEAEQTRPVGTTVGQGYVEESNVVVTEEVVRMIETLRNFESCQKVLQTFDETDTKLITEVGKL